MNFPDTVIALILLIIVWLYLDFKLGRSKHLRIFHQRTTPILYGNFDIFPHGKELFADYFDEIIHAEHHIHILFYIVRNDHFSQEFFTLLKTKAQEGLEVRLLIDRLGSIQVKKEILTELRKAGVQIAFSNRIKLPFLFYSSQVRNHRKISIIDGKIGYLGGFNIGKEYIDEDPKLSPWRDYHLKITGESVPFLQGEFLVDWKEYAQENFVNDSAYILDQPKGSVPHQIVPAEAGLLEMEYLTLVRGAAKSIMIGSPYFIPSKKLMKELLLAINRGVSITVVVPYTTDHILVQEASYRYLRTLLKEGARVYQYKKGFYHAKSLVFDDKICDIGTANFDKRSLFLNKEINCYFHDPAFVQRFKDVLQKDILDSKPLTLADLNQPNLFRSFKEVIAGAVSYFL
ncbi:cardiolipin synthase [Neobacillus niacini]|uniref:cardiolipin synthase n=1 Tax=Neobacillus niacini TaxID=86668 RepID=UPI0030000B8C